MSSQADPGEVVRSLPEGRADAPASADTAAMPASASSAGAGRRRRRSPRPPRGLLDASQINNEIWLSILPVAAFLIVDRVADTRAAIGAGFALALLVFWRTRKSGLIGYLAIGGIVIVGGAALVGIILDSDKAFFASDAVGDFIWAGALVLSICVGRPLIGVFIREMFPAVRDWVAERHRVFIVLTLAWAAQNVLTGGIRLVLLDSMSTDSYLLWSRVAIWPLNIILFAISYHLISRAIHDEAERRFRDEPAPLEEGA